MPGIVDRIRYLFTGKQPAADTRGQQEARERMRDSLLHTMRAKIDSAATTDENRKHWNNADFLSADSAYDPSVRFRLRNRARYEGINNCYAKGSIRSSADDMIGTGPRLQVSIPGDTDGAAAKIVERNFAGWTDETKLAIKLRVAQKSRVRDGECFGIFDTNNALENPVKFDTRWVEAEMCTSVFTLGTDPNMCDGIKFDAMGLPVEYYFLAMHPGNVIQVGLQPLKFYTIPARNVVHWFAMDRFGQHRAIPEITAALPLYAQVRRYTLATLTAAEFASMLAGIMKTDAPAEDGAQVTNVGDWNMFELVRGALLSLPAGWEATQFNSSQPTTTYGDFKKEILNESGRATNQPLNVVTGNSSGYNYSSGRLDHLPYQRGIRIERNDLRLMVLDPIFRAWYSEAVQVGQVPQGLPPLAEWSWTWTWDGFDSVDPAKDAAADDSRIKNGTQTYSETYSAYGQDWQEQFDQLAREKAYAEAKGLPWPVLAPTAMPKPANEQDPEAAKPGTMEEVVRGALSQAGVPDAKANRILEALAATFNEMRDPQRNGHHRNGFARGGVA